MSYLLILELGGDGGTGRVLGRRLKRAAREVQRSVWEFKSLPDLLEAAELVRKAGGKAMAFSQKDEILLHVSEARKLLR
jgi:hypothetical protein